MVTADDIRTRLDAIEERAARALMNPSGQQYDAAVLLASDLPAVVAALRDALAEVEGQTLVARQYERERDTARAEVGALTPVCSCTPYHAGGDGPEEDCPVHGATETAWGEIQRLRAEVERLRATIADAVAGLSVAWPTTEVPWIAATVRALATTEAGEES